ncbi:Protein N-acetyltransferase, RimJ/RimL family [Sphingomonas guangdongensis]|uniref:Protein N-acetyltransferase, RimJ/RimL family n=1 Tax=Sphingomonas guangdongensis TaxID=1141890 RepID=A0A285R6Y7_9SPHN|nr:GNAT family N-acetyltransferase [Sphingomonas guangdongensis]SOB88127.1 Protein N-acetyltransferase, RimJ/RimL family [Sphingomonas guangdongensis]
MITTARLRLRNWEERDLALFAAMSADAEVMRHLDGPIDRAASEAVIERLRGHAERDGFTFWAVERREDDLLLGFCGLRRGGHPDTPVSAELEIGWRLARANWGQGYAGEAATATIAWGWANTPDARIAAWTVPANTASWRLMERVGMRHRPTLDFDHPRFPAGHPLRRHLVYTVERPA